MASGLSREAMTSLLGALQLGAGELDVVFMCFMYDKVI
jgi:hypothetical protein